MCLGPSHPHCDQRVGKNQEYSAPAKPASQTAPASPASQTAPEGYSTRLRHPCTLQLGMQRTRAARERSCAVALLRCVSILREPLRELSKIGSMSWYNNRVGPQCDSTKFRVKNPWRCHSQMHHQSGKGISLVLRWLCVTLRYILTFCVTTYGLYCRVRTLSDSRMYLRYTRALRPPPAGGLRERAK